MKELKAFVELPVPVSCKECRIAFFYTDVNEDDVIGCGYLNCDVTEYEDRRAPDCPLKIKEG
jgi:hypothetical protein